MSRPRPAVDVGERVKGEHGGGWGVGGGGRAVEGAWVEEGVVVVVHVVVVGLGVEVVVVVGEIHGGGGGGGGGVRWRVEEVVGDERVGGVVVEDLAVGLVGGRGGVVLVSGEHYRRGVPPFVVQHVSTVVGVLRVKQRSGIDGKE